MPRNTQTKRDKKLAALVKAYYLDDADARQPRETAWRNAYKRADPSYVDKTKVKGPFKIKVPYAYRALETQTGQLMQASEANGRWVIARSATPEHGNVGEVVTQALENEFRRTPESLAISNEESLEEYARMGLNYGNSYQYVEYESIDGADDGGIKLTSLDPFDVFLDWKHKRHFIIRHVVTLEELRRKAMALSADVIETREDPETRQEVEVNLGPRDGGRAIRAWRKVDKAIRSGRVTGFLHESFAADHSRARQSDLNRVEGSDDGVDEGRVPLKDDPFNARVTLLEYHETKSNGIIAWIIPSFGGPEEDLVLRSEPNPYGICQIVPFKPRPVDKEAYGFGLGEVLGHTSEAMDVFYRAALRFIVRVADPAVLYRKGLRLRQEYLRSQSGISIPVNDTENDIRYMQPPGQAGLHQLGFGFARDMADLGTGESEQRRGQVGGASSATEAAIAEASSTMTDRRIFSRWRRSIQQIGRVMLQVMKVHMNRDRMIPAVGRNADTFYRLKPAYLEGKFEVVFGGSSVSVTPAQRQAGFRNIAQTYAASGVVDVAELARADVRELGEPDPDRFMTVKDEVVSISPEQEHKALFKYGEEIEVSPRDNHMQHLIKHFRMEQRMRADGHPAADLLTDHMMEHFMAIQVQQQAALPEAAGAAPFQPQQAGQPGQPGVFTPSTQQAVAARQDSNNGSPGASPGPGVVPNRGVGRIAFGGPN